MCTRRGLRPQRPRVSCLDSGRALEQAVNLLYDVVRLPIPYRDDLSAKISAPEFRNVT